MADVGDEGNTAGATAAAGTAAGVSTDQTFEAAAGGVQPMALQASSRAIEVLSSIGRARGELWFGRAAAGTAADVGRVWCFGWLLMHARRPLARPGPA